VSLSMWRAGPSFRTKAANALELVASRQIKDKVREILLDLAPRDRLPAPGRFFSTSATETKSAANIWSGPRLSASAAPSRQTGVQIRVCEACRRPDGSGRKYLEKREGPRILKRFGARGHYKGLDRIGNELMDHSEAVEQMAAERYLLDELTPDAREASRRTSRLS